MTSIANHDGTPHHAFPPYRLYGTRSLRPLEDLFETANETIGKLWSAAGGMHYRPLDSITRPIAAKVVPFTRKPDPRARGPKTRLDIHCLLIAQWKPARSRSIMLGALWLSDDEPVLRTLRLKECIISSERLARTWEDRPLHPRAPAILRIAMDVVAGLAFRAFDNTDCMAITENGWKQLEGSRRRAVPFYPPAARKAPLVVLPQVKRLLGLTESSRTQPWVNGALMTADEESVFTDGSFVRMYMRT